MDTFGAKTKRVCQKEESYSINHSFVAQENIPNHALVKYNADGTVSLVKVAEDVPFGLVSAGAKAGELVTIQTEFNAIIEVEASGALAVNDEVSQRDIATDGITPKYAKVTTGVSAGKVLVGGATGTRNAVVGIYRVFKKLS